MDDFISTFAQAAVGGIPLILVVFVLVELTKRITKADGSQAVTGNGLTLASFGYGVVLGVGYYLFQTRPPAGDWYNSYVYWFAAAVYGIALGGGASVFYEAIKSLVDKIIGRYMAQAKPG